MGFEASTLEGFVQALAVDLIARGHWFYVQGTVPEGKDPRAIDSKLVARYGADLSRFERCRRKRAGLASVRYLRYGRTFVLVATMGEHRFFEEEAGIRDVRKAPIKLRRVRGFLSRGARLGPNRAGGMEVAAGLLPGSDSQARRRMNLAEEFLGWPYEPMGSVTSCLRVLTS